VLAALLALVTTAFLGLVPGAIILVAMLVEVSA
jgi:hypothetical protein